MNLDVINSALQDLDPKLEETFLKAHPLFDSMVQKGKVTKKKLEGRYKEFTVLTGGPGQITAIHVGDETISSGRKVNSQKGNEYATRMLYHYDIPLKDLADADGKYNLVKILEQYPLNATFDFYRQMAAQLSRGAASAGTLGADYDQCAGFLTLNGDQVYRPTGASGPAGARNGFFQYADPSAQTASVHNLVSEGGTGGVTGWFNHYKNIGNFETEGMRALRELVIRTSNEGHTFDSHIDMMFADLVSYLNYHEELERRVDATAVKGSLGHSGADYNGREGIPWSSKCMLYQDPELDISDTTSYTSAAPRTGLVIGFDTSAWEMFSKGSDANKETNGLFATRDGFRIPDKEAFRFEVVFHAQLFCRSRRSQFVLTGSAL